MAELIACLSTGKGTWADVAKLMGAEQWDKIILITNQFGKEKFNPTAGTELLPIDDTKPMDLLTKDIINLLKDKILGPDVAVNFISGSGKEHMALLSALLKLGLGVRLVHVHEDKVVEI